MKDTKIILFFLLLMKPNSGVLKQTKYLPFFSFFFGLLRVAPAAYGGSQARSQVKAKATGLHHSHNNAGSTPHLQPTQQVMAMPDP